MRGETVGELLTWKPPEIEHLIGGGILIPGSRMVVFGRWGTWKSMLAMHTCFCLALGRSWFGFPTIKCGVLMAQVEIPKILMRNRLIKYVHNNVREQEIPGNMWVITEPDLRLDKPYWMEKFRLNVATFRPKAIVLDPFYRLYSGDIKDNAQINVLMDVLDNLAKTYELAIILVGHTRKQATIFKTDSMEHELIGGSYLMDWADTVLAIKQVQGVDNWVDVEWLKARHAEVELEPMGLQVDRNTLRFSIRADGNGATPY